MIKPPTTRDLFVFLVQIGFRYYKPVCKTWVQAFILKSEESLLCILVRKNGIDFRLYENYSGGVVVDNRIEVSMSGGKLYRNHYNESKALLTLKAMSVAKLFLKGTLSEDIRIEDGRSYFLNPNYDNIKGEAKRRFKKEWERRVDKKNAHGVTDALNASHGYWGDDQWA